MAAARASGTVTSSRMKFVTLPHGSPSSAILTTRRKIHIEESYSRLHPDDLSYVQAAIQAHFDQRTAFYEVEHRIRCKDGSYKWVLSRGKVTERTEDGSPLRMVGTTTDITATRSLAEQLKLQNARLRDNAAKLSALTRELAERTRELEAAHRLAKVVSWRWDLQNRSIHFSRELWEIMGLPPSEAPVTYDQIKLLHHPDDYHRAIASYYTALHSKSPVTLECRIVQPDGVVHHVLTHVEPIVQPDGSVTQLRGTSQNITALPQHRSGAARQRGSLSPYGGTPPANSLDGRTGWRHSRGRTEMVPADRHDPGRDASLWLDHGGPSG